MPKWLAHDSKDCYKTYIMDTKEEAEEASGSYAVPVGSRFADGRKERKVVYRPGFPQTYNGGGCVSTLCCGLFIILAFAFVFTYFVP